MRFPIARLMLPAALAIAGQILIAPAFADQKDPILPELFERLMKAPSPGEAQEIDALIWHVWLKAGSPELDTLMAQGSEAMDNGEYATAMTDFNKIIAARPDFAEGWNKRATLYYLMEDYKNSLADIDKTLALEPRHFGALSGLGLVNIKLEKYEEAVKAYQRVLAVDPQNAGAKANLDVVNDLIKKKSI